MPTEHVLKTSPIYFNHLVTGEKTFEVRIDHRSYQTGDTLILREYDVTKNHECDDPACTDNRWTGRELTYRVGFTYKGDLLNAGIILSLLPVDR